MNIKIIALLLFISNQLLSQTPAFEWAKSFGSVGNEYARDITTDQNGNVFTVGSFTYTTDFDPGPAVFNLSPIGVSDTYITKFDQNGNFIWAKRLGSGGAYNAKTYGHSIKIDPSGNILIFGIFSTNTDLDPSPSSSFIFTTIGLDTGVLFLTKLNNDGNFIWGKKIDNYGHPEDFPGKMALDNSGNIYITGSFWGTIDFDPNPSNYHPLESDGLQAGFLLKLNNDGSFIFAKAFKQQAPVNNFQSGIARQATAIDPNYVKTYDITIDKNSNIYIYGQFLGTVEFSVGNGCPPCYTPIVLSTAGNYMFLPSNRFVVKLSANGNAIFAKKIEQEVKANAIGVNSAGDIYLTGSFAGSFGFNLDNPYPNNNTMSPIGNQDIFVMKYNNAGVFQWAKKYGTINTNCYASAIAFDLNSNLYIQGGFSKNLDFDNNPSTPNTLIKSNPSVNNSDYYIAKLSSDGSFIWATSVGTNNLYLGTKLHIDNVENIYTTGIFEGLNSQNLITKGFRDSFIQKFSTNKYTLKSGNWTDPTVWSQGTIPTLYDGAIINSSHIIELNSLANIKKIFNNGTIQFGNSGQIKFNN